jgi:hypothetical protein
VLRERLPGEARPDPCGWGCASESDCAADRDFWDLAAEETVFFYGLCGGRERRSWPRPGGLAAQDAVLVYRFAAIDVLLAQEEARVRAAAEKARG